MPVVSTNNGLHCAGAWQLLMTNKIVTMQSMTHLFGPTQSPPILSGLSIPHWTLVHACGGLVDAWSHSLHLSAFLSPHPHRGMCPRLSTGPYAFLRSTGLRVTCKYAKRNTADWWLTWP